jgi:hypothetical protein
MEKGDKVRTKRKIGKIKEFFPACIGKNPPST